MTELVIDPMDDADAWSALAPDDTASTVIGITTVASPVRFPNESTSLELTFSEAALDHRVERTLAGLNLTSFDEIRFAIQSTRVADGSAAPFFLRLALASAAMGFDAAENTWHRFAPVGRSGAWELVRLALSDLHPDVRGAVSGVRVTCLDAAVGFTVNFSPWIAAHDEMIVDAEAALLARLHQVFDVDGTSVDAVLYHSATNEEPTAPTPPALRLRLADVTSSVSRTYPTVRRDFNDSGFTLSPRVEPYDLIYEVEAFGASRAHKARILDFVLRELAPHSALIVGARALPVQRLPSLLDEESHAPEIEPALRFRVGTQQELTVPIAAARLPEEILVEVDQP